jgi:N-acetylglutamate synthase-like GNAT family acetyltransferase
MHSRSYRESDRDDCLACFDSNSPTHIPTQQRTAFEAFLDHHPDGYFVVLEGHELIGCGGIDVHDGIAELVWIVVHAEWQTQGAGSLLMTACITDTLSRLECNAVTLTCSQHARAYFERWGLRAIDSEPNGIAPGIDRVQMRMELNDESRAAWHELVSAGLEPAEIEETIPAIESYKEWTAHRYDPGHYLGGQLAPHLDTSRMGTHARRRSALLLVIIALITTGGYVSMLDADSPVAARIAGTAISVMTWAAAARMFLSSRQ